MRSDVLDLNDTHNVHVDEAGLEVLQRGSALARVRRAVVQVGSVADAGQNGR